MRVSKRSPRITLALLLLVGLTFACRPGAPDTVVRTDGIAELRKADSALQAAVQARDLAGTMDFYADDAVLLPLAKPIAEGRDAVREEWEHTFGIPSFANVSRATAVDVSLDGTLGLTRGTYEATMKAPDGQSVVEHGKWVSVWRRAPNGSWRIVADIYNTDSLPPDHQPSTADAHEH